MLFSGQYPKDTVHSHEILFLSLRYEPLEIERVAEGSKKVKVYHKYSNIRTHLRILVRYVRHSLSDYVDNGIETIIPSPSMLQSHWIVQNGAGAG